MSEIIYIQDDGKKRKATPAELEQMAKDRAEAELQASLIEAEQTKKAEAKASALAKLTALGLSETEVQALIS